MRPNPVDEQGIGRGNMNRDGPHPTRDPIDGNDDLLAESVEEERVDDLNELRRHEAPLIITTDQDRMLRRALHAVVDDDEAVVRAEADLTDRLRAPHDAGEAPGRGQHFGQPQSGDPVDIRLSRRDRRQAKVARRGRTGVPSRLLPVAASLSCRSDGADCEVGLRRLTCVPKKAAQPRRTAAAGDSGSAVPLSVAAAPMKNAARKGGVFQ